MRMPKRLSSVVLALRRPWEFQGGSDRPTPAAMHSDDVTCLCISLPLSLSFLFTIRSWHHIDWRQPAAQQLRAIWECDQWSVHNSLTVHTLLHATSLVKRIDPSSSIEFLFAPISGWTMLFCLPRSLLLEIGHISNRYRSWMELHEGTYLKERDCSNSKGFQKGSNACLLLVCMFNFQGCP